jgi:Zn-dependent peptidase ImmA (M78 family)/DNA-binding XRE family transcriptional regulator
MLRKDLAYITPALLTWAIDRSGLDRGEFAKKIHVKTNVIEAWEKGLGYPQFNKARELADVLHVEFGYLFLNEVPTDTVPLPDLRRLPDSPALSPSREFLSVLYQAMLQHDWYRAYLIDEEVEPRTFVSKFKPHDAISLIASDIRTTLGMDHDLRRAASNWDNYLTKLSQRAEAAGVIVMRRAVVGSSRRKLDRQEFQGFAISEPMAPLVFVNGQDFQAPKIFTLLHELAHIWIGQSGISRIDETLQTPTLEIERVCNEIATEALVPKIEFESEWKNNSDYEQVDRLARYFLVSALVIIRRAKELNKISGNTFGVFLTEAKKRLKPKAKPKGKTGNFYTTLDSRNSPNFVNALLGDVRREGTLYRDAARLLSMEVKTVVKMVEGLNTS